LQEHNPPPAISQKKGGHKPWSLSPAMKDLRTLKLSASWKRCHDEYLWRKVIKEFLRPTRSFGARQEETFTVRHFTTQANNNSQIKYSSSNTIPMWLRCEKYSCITHVQLTAFYMAIG
jgi:hypothetical protein